MKVTPIVIGPLKLEARERADQLVVVWVTAIDGSLDTCGTLIVTRDVWQYLEQLAKLQAAVTVARFTLAALTGSARDKLAPADREMLHGAIRALDLVSDPTEPPIFRAPEDTPELRAKIAELQSVADRNLITDEQIDRSVARYRMSRVTFNGTPMPEARSRISQLVDDVRIALNKQITDPATRYTEAHAGWTSQPHSTFEATIDGRRVKVTIEVNA